MEQRYVNQFGGGSIYIEENNGTINYFRAATPFDVAVRDNSYELEHCTPDIEPKLVRPEVGEIVSWIDKCADKKNPNRVALVYGMPGIGKTAVMNMVYSSLKGIT
jgi:Cdc6-like AAA superfamily ATPase